MWRPGEFLTANETALRLRAFSHESGLAEADILITAWGYPPLPRPPDDPARRFPAGLHPTFAGHPVFWLDPDTRAPRADEEPAVRAIRLWFELVDRGWIVQGTGETVCVLRVAGFDLADPSSLAEINRRVVVGGGGWLPRVEIGPGPSRASLGADWAAGAAARAAAEHRADYAQFVEEWARPDRDARLEAEAAIDRADFGPHRARFEAAIGDQAAFDVAVDDVVDEMLELEHDRRLIRLGVERFARVGDNGSLADLETALDRGAWADRQRVIGDLLDAAAGAPTDRYRAEQVTMWLSSLHEAVTARARAVVWAAKLVEAAPPAPGGVTFFTGKLPEHVTPPEWADGGEAPARH